ncbi:hypothetical protein NGM10_13980 [Halorussus salilacus]|uniref:DUF7553 family protein n=1 Tax=Halorussus salilacus TaxID=2953750 RepID=UPI0020A135A5|nr:hypothetical protein [Halorussus salilacus]USZ67829.1 hypothetical protein NGM10_13980 [Halorussus salilacus]
MNKHFRDAWYYARRAGEHLSRGLREELDPVERRVRAATGRERKESTRAEKWRAQLKAREHEVERRARRALRQARDRV